METSNKRRAVCVDGNIKLILEILEVSHDHYLRKRDYLIFKLHFEHKMTYKELAFKFGLAKSNITNICSRIKAEQSSITE